ncbi:MAG: hypothetical protein ACRCWH_12470, partial [Aeromonas veronii]
MSYRNVLLVFLNKINTKVSYHNPDKSDLENLIKAFDLLPDDTPNNVTLINEAMRLLTNFYSRNEFQGDILKFIKTDSFTIPFSQNDLITPTLAKDDWFGVYLKEGGACFGIATQYINYEMNGRGDEYIEYLNKISLLMKKTVDIHGNMEVGTVAHKIKHHVHPMLSASLTGILQSQLHNIESKPNLDLSSFINELDNIDVGVPKYMCWHAKGVVLDEKGREHEESIGHAMAVTKNKDGTYDVMDPNKGKKKGVSINDAWLILFGSALPCASTLKETELTFSIDALEERWFVPESELPTLSFEDVSHIVIWKGKETVAAKSKKLIADLSKKKTSYFFEIIHADGTRQEIGVKDIDPNLNLKFDGKFSNKIDNDIDTLIGKGVKKNYTIKGSLLNEKSLAGKDWLDKNRFGLGGDGEGDWTPPSNEEFINFLKDNETSIKLSKYDRNLIFQLHSEEIVNESVLNLLGKHPEQ